MISEGKKVDRDDLAKKIRREEYLLQLGEARQMLAKIRLERQRLLQKDLEYLDNINGTEQVCAELENKISMLDQGLDPDAPPKEEEKING